MEKITSIRPDPISICMTPKEHREYVVGCMTLAVVVTITVLSLVYFLNAPKA